MDLRGGTTISGYTIWHGGNMGTSSGLSADMLRDMIPDVTSAANSIVQRDASGNFSASIITTSTTKAGTFGILDTGTAYYLNIVSDSTAALTADRTLTIDVNNAARTFILGANLTINTALTVGTGAVTLNGHASGSTLTITNTGTTTLASTLSNANYALYLSGANTIGAEQYLNVTRGGTGAGTFTANAILTGNTTSAIQAPGPTLTSTALSAPALTSADVATTALTGATINIGTAATTSGTKAINIGTAGTTGSTTTISIGTTAGTTPTIALSGAVTITSAVAGVTSNHIAGSFFKIAATAAPTADLFQITNTGQVNVTNGVSGMQLSYFAALTGTNESSAGRFDITNTSTTVGTTTNGLRLYITGSSTANVVTNGLKLETSGATGIENAIYVGTNWDNILNYNGTTIISGTGTIDRLYATAAGTAAIAWNEITTGSITIGAGANTSGTKTINIGTSGGLAGTTAITLGSATGTTAASTTTVNGRLIRQTGQDLAAWGVSGPAINSVAATFKDTSSTNGTVATVTTAHSLGIPTYTATNATVTYTSAANLYIAGGPTASTNVVITNKYALYVAADTAYLANLIVPPGNHLTIPTSAPAAPIAGDIWLV